MTSQFVSRLLTQPWDISEAHGRTILGTMLSRLRTKADRPDEDAWGDAMPKLQITGDVAVIPMRGVLMVNVPDWIKPYALGLTDVDDVAAELSQAVNDPAVALIVLDMDSPGGESMAGAKMFDLVETANAKKPVCGWCADGAQVCSAAFNSIAPCRANFTAKYATVGSIGTYLAVLDDTKYWEMLGFTWEVFRSGELKGMGEDGFSESQKAFLQSLSDSWGARFRKNVAKYRTTLAPEQMQGQWYNGDEAARLGFTHGIAKDFDAAVRKFRGLI